MNNSIKVGLFTFFALCLIVFALIWKSGFIAETQGFELKGSFTNISGLLEGSDVRYRGFKVGMVKGIKSGLKDIIVELKINKKISFPIDSFLRIEFDGLIGEKYIAIVPGKNTQLNHDRKSILPGVSSAGLVDFVDIGSKNLEETKKIFELIYKILADGSIEQSLKNTLSNAEEISLELNKTAPKLNKLLDNLNITVLEFNKFATDKTLQGNIKKTFANASKASEEMNQLAKHFNQDTMQKIDVLLKEHQNLAKSLNSLSTNELKESLQSIERLTTQLDKILGDILKEL